MSHNILWFIQWILVPGIMVLILLYGLFLPHTALNTKAKTSGNAGILAGMILFVLFIISQQTHPIEFAPEVITVELQLSSLLLLIAGICVGFFVRLLLELIIGTRLLGAVVSIIIAATTIGLYSFFFIKAIRISIMFESLGMLLGAFIYKMIFPDKVLIETNSQELKDGIPTADGLLRNLTKYQRIEAYDGLCDYLRWVLKKQGDTGGLAKAEGVIENLESFFKEKVEAKEVSADEANDIKSYKIWIIAHQESRSAPNRIALWDAAERLPESIKDYDKTFIKCRESVKREFAEKLCQYVNLGES